MTWLKNKERYFKYADMLIDKVIDFVIVDLETYNLSKFRNALICDNPKLFFSLIVTEFFSEKKPNNCVGHSSIIELGASIGNDCYIGEHCYIGKNVRIGSNVKIYHNVIIEGNTTIGNNCCIKSGTVIGQEGYGYAKNENNTNVRVPHQGGVVIDDYVDIGSNTCIDKGTIGNTYIGKGSKIDNLCHIAHNVKIGKNVMIVAGTIICGSATIEDNVYIAPGAIIKNQVKIADSTLVGLGSVILNDTEKNKVYIGVPAHDIRERKDENL